MRTFIRYKPLGANTRVKHYGAAYKPVYIAGGASPQPSDAKEENNASAFVPAGPAEGSAA
jgi:hypothetical protein